MQTSHKPWPESDISDAIVGPPPLQVLHKDDPAFTLCRTLTNASYLFFRCFRYIAVDALCRTYIGVLKCDGQSASLPP